MTSIQRFYAIEPVNDYRGAGTTLAGWQHLLTYTVAYTAYSIGCVYYEYRESCVSQDSRPLVGKARNPKWDVLKLVLLCCVIIIHSDQAIFGLGPTGLHSYHYLIRYNLGAFTLSSFAFVSGVFGDNSSYKSMKKMTCTLVGAAIFTSLLCDLIILCTPGEKRPMYVHDMTWYLLAVCAWRWTVSPLFNALDKYAIPSIVSWLCVFCACYLFAHGISFHNTFYWGYFAFWFYTPFYALGRCLQRETWTKLLDNEYLLYAAIATVFFWCVAMLYWGDFQEWNDVVCVRNYCSRKSWPGPYTSDDGISLAGFVDACRVFLLKAWWSFAVIWLIAAATPMQSTFAGFLAGCGARTIYGYVLHIVAHVYLGVRLGLPLIVDWLPEWMSLAIVLVMCVLATFVWCSQLSQLLFSWMVEPLWILELMPGEEAVDPAKKGETKSGTEPA